MVEAPDEDEDSAEDRAVRAATDLMKMVIYEIGERLSAFAALAGTLHALAEIAVEQRAARAMAADIRRLADHIEARAGGRDARDSSAAGNAGGRGSLN